MPARIVKTKDYAPVVQSCSSDTERLMISDCGRIYFAIQPKAGLHNEGLFKLHRIPMSEQPRYVWLAMWNSIVWTSIGGMKSWATIEAALADAIREGWTVCQMNEDNLKSIVDAIKHEEQRAERIS